MPIRPTQDSTLQTNLLMQDELVIPTNYFADQFRPTVGEIAETAAQFRSAARQTNEIHYIHDPKTGAPITVDDLTYEALKSEYPEFMQHRSAARAEDQATITSRVSLGQETGMNQATDMRLRSIYRYSVSSTLDQLDWLSPLDRDLFLTEISDEAWDREVLDLSQNGFFSYFILGGSQSLGKGQDIPRSEIMFDNLRAWSGRDSEWAIRYATPENIISTFSILFGETHPLITKAQAGDEDALVQMRGMVSTYEGASRTADERVIDRIKYHATEDFEMQRIVAETIGQLEDSPFVAESMQYLVEGEMVRRTLNYLNRAPHILFNEKYTEEQRREALATIRMGMRIMGPDFFQEAFTGVVVPDFDATEAWEKLDAPTKEMLNNFGLTLPTLQELGFDPQNPVTFNFLIQQELAKQMGSRERRAAIERDMDWWITQQAASLAYDFWRGVADDPVAMSELLPTMITGVTSGVFLAKSGLTLGGLFAAELAYGAAEGAWMGLSTSESVQRQYVSLGLIPEVDTGQMYQDALVMGAMSAGAQTFFGGLGYGAKRLYGGGAAGINLLTRQGVFGEDAQQRAIARELALTLQNDDVAAMRLIAPNLTQQQQVLLFKAEIEAVDAVKKGIENRVEGDVDANMSAVGDLLSPSTLDAMGISQLEAANFIAGVLGDLAPGERISLDALTELWRGYLTRRSELVGKPKTDVGVDAKPKTDVAGEPTPRPDVEGEAKPEVEGEAKPKPEVEGGAKPKEGDASATRARRLQEELVLASADDVDAHLVLAAGRSAAKDAEVEEARLLAVAFLSGEDRTAASFMKIVKLIPRLADRRVLADFQAFFNTKAVVDALGQANVDKINTTIKELIDTSDAAYKADPLLKKAVAIMSLLQRTNDDATIRVKQDGSSLTTREILQAITAYIKTATDPTARAGLIARYGDGVLEGLIEKIHKNVEDVYETVADSPALAMRAFKQSPEYKKMRAYQAVRQKLVRAARRAQRAASETDRTKILAEARDTYIKDLKKLEKEYGDVGIRIDDADTVLTNIITRAENYRNASPNQRTLLMAQGFARLIDRVDAEAISGAGLATDMKSMDRLFAGTSIGDRIGQFWSSLALFPQSQSKLFRSRTRIVRGLANFIGNRHMGTTRYGDVSSRTIEGAANSAKRQVAPIISAFRKIRAKIDATSYGQFQSLVAYLRMTGKMELLRKAANNAEELKKFTDSLPPELQGAYKGNFKEMVDDILGVHDLITNYNRQMLEEARINGMLRLNPDGTPAMRIDPARYVPNTLNSNLKITKQNELVEQIVRHAIEQESDTRRGLNLDILQGLGWIKPISERNVINPATGELTGEVRWEVPADSPFSGITGKGAEADGEYIVKNASKGRQFLAELGQEAAERRAKAAAETKTPATPKPTETPSVHARPLSHNGSRDTPRPTSQRQGAQASNQANHVTGADPVINQIHERMNVMAKIDLDSLSAREVMDLVAEHLALSEQLRTRQLELAREYSVTSRAAGQTTVIRRDLTARQVEQLSKDDAAFSQLSVGHAELVGRLDTLVQNGTLTVAHKRMIMAVYAPLDLNMTVGLSIRTRSALDTKLDQVFAMAQELGKAPQEIMDAIAKGHLILNEDAGILQTAAGEAWRSFIPDLAELVAPTGGNITLKPNLRQSQWAALIVVHEMSHVLFYNASGALQAALQHMYKDLVNGGLDSPVARFLRANGYGDGEIKYAMSNVHEFVAHMAEAILAGKPLKVANRQGLHVIKRLALALADLFDQLFFKRNNLDSIAKRAGFTQRDWADMKMAIEALHGNVIAQTRVADGLRNRWTTFGTNTELRESVIFFDQYTTHPHVQRSLEGADDDAQLSFHENAAAKLETELADLNMRIDAMREEMMADDVSPAREREFSELVNERNDLEEAIANSKKGAAKTDLAELMADLDDAAVERFALLMQLTNGDILDSTLRNLLNNNMYAYDIKTGGSAGERVWLIDPDTGDTLPEEALKKIAKKLAMAYNKEAKKSGSSKIVGQTGQFETADMKAVEAVDRSVEQPGYEAVTDVNSREGVGEMITAFQKLIDANSDNLDSKTVAKGIAAMRVLQFAHEKDLPISNSVIKALRAESTKLRGETRETFIRENSLRAYQWTKLTPEQQDELVELGKTLGLTKTDLKSPGKLISNLVEAIKEAETRAPETRSDVRETINTLTDDLNEKARIEVESLAANERTPVHQATSELIEERRAIDEAIRTDSRTPTEQEQDAIEATLEENPLLRSVTAANAAGETGKVAPGHPAGTEELVAKAREVETVEELDDFLEEIAPGDPRNEDIATETGKLLIDEKRQPITDDLYEDVSEDYADEIYAGELLAVYQVNHRGTDMHIELRRRGDDTVEVAFAAADTGDYYDMTNLGGVKELLGKVLFKALKYADDNDIPNVQFSRLGNLFGSDFGMDTPNGTRVYDKLIRRYLKTANTNWGLTSVTMDSTDATKWLLTRGQSSLAPIDALAFKRAAENDLLSMIDSLTQYEAFFVEQISGSLLESLNIDVAITSARQITAKLEANMARIPDNLIEHVRGRINTLREAVDRAEAGIKTPEAEAEAPAPRVEPDMLDQADIDALLQAIELASDEVGVPKPEPEVKAAEPEPEATAVDSDALLRDLEDAGDALVRAFEAEGDPVVKAAEPEPEATAADIDALVEALEDALDEGRVPKPEVKAAEPEPEVKAAEPEPEVKAAEADGGAGKPPEEPPTAKGAADEPEPKPEPTKREEAISEFIDNLNKKYGDDAINRLLDVGKPDNVRSHAKWTTDRDLVSDYDAAVAGDSTGALRNRAQQYVNTNMSNTADAQRQGATGTDIDVLVGHSGGSIDSSLSRRFSDADFETEAGDQIARIFADNMDYVGNMISNARNIGTRVKIQGLLNEAFGRGVTIQDLFTQAHKALHEIIQTDAKNGNVTGVKQTALLREADEAIKQLKLMYLHTLGVPVTQFDPKSGLGRSMNISKNLAYSKLGGTFSQMVALVEAPFALLRTGGMGPMQILRNVGNFIGAIVVAGTDVARLNIPGFDRLLSSFGLDGEGCRFIASDLVTYMENFDGTSAMARFGFSGDQGNLAAFTFRDRVRATRNRMRQARTGESVGDETAAGWTANAIEESTAVVAEWTGALSGMEQITDIARSIGINIGRSTVVKYGTKLIELAKMIEAAGTQVSQKEMIGMARKLGIPRAIAVRAGHTGLLANGGRSLEIIRDVGGVRFGGSDGSRVNLNEINARMQQYQTDMRAQGFMTDADAKAVRDQAAALETLQEYLLGYGRTASPEAKGSQTIGRGDPLQQFLFSMLSYPVAAYQELVVNGVKTNGLAATAGALSLLAAFEFNARMIRTMMNGTEEERDEAKELYMKALTGDLSSREYMHMLANYGTMSPAFGHFGGWMGEALNLGTEVLAPQEPGTSEAFKNRFPKTPFASPVIGTTQSMVGSFLRGAQEVAEIVGGKEESTVNKQIQRTKRLQKMVAEGIDAFTPFNSGLVQLGSQITTGEKLGDAIATTIITGREGFRYNAPGATMPGQYDARRMRMYNQVEQYENPMQAPDYMSRLQGQFNAAQNRPAPWQSEAEKKQAEAGGQTPAAPASTPQVSTSPSSGLADLLRQQ